MRPQQLTFSGLRSYPRDHTTIDFSGKELVGILGDTGAGKSTILEALCVALYGRCSWSDREVRDLIADSSPTMSVDLTFTHNRQRWRVRRTYHRNTNPSTHLLENLDTGDEIDNARPVDAAIATMLRLRYDAFRSCVLLPQGRFAALLQASDRTRTELLKGLFGVEVIERVRLRANQRREALRELTHRAELARNGLRSDPAATAAAARQHAGTADDLAGQFTTELKQLRALQDDARRARDRAILLEQAAAQLEEIRLTTLVDANRRLSEIAEIEAVITVALRELDAAETHSRTTRAESEAVLAEADRAGEGPLKLAAASVLLADLPQILAKLVTEYKRLTTKTEELASQSDGLAARDKHLQHDAAGAEHLAQQANEAKEVARQTHAAVASLQQWCTLVLDAAAAAAAATLARQKAGSEAEATEAKLPDLRLDLAAAYDEHRHADHALVAMRRGDSAATAGADLHSGDPCPVCTRGLPDDYHPPTPTDPAQLADAQKTLERASEAIDKAGQKLAAATERAKIHRRQAAQHDDNARAAARKLDRQMAEVRTAVAELASTQLRHKAALVDVDKFMAGVAEAATTVASSDGDQERTTRTAALTRLMKAARDLETTRELAAADAADIASRAADQLSTARQRLEEDRAAHRQNTRQLADDRQLHQAVERELRERLATLPPTPRGFLTDSLTQLPDLAQVHQATAAHAARRKVVDDHASQVSRATADLQAAAERRLALTTRTSDEVSAPLQVLLRDLSAAAAEVRRAAELLGAGPPLPLVPAAPQHAVSDTVRPFAAGLATCTDRVLTTLTNTKDAETTHLENLIAEISSRLSAALDTQASALESGGPSTICPEATSGKSAAGDPLDSSTLDPVTNAASHWRTEAARARDLQREAEAQIEPAANLDEALKSGRLRLAALDKLHSLLTDSTFVRYLIDSRTLALLGVASELFGRLTGGQLGLAEDLRVVNRQTAVARSPRTLSGGETFLGSLALALALVEVYSRSGGELGALFLDEGFDGLDADHLATALAVVREEAGDDKLIAVISHLHSIAEAVEDVLWVERTIDRSSARWLDDAEQETLVRDDIAQGLLALVS